MKGFLFFFSLVVGTILISAVAFSVEYDIHTISKDGRELVDNDLKFLNGLKLSKQSPLHIEFFGKNQPILNFFENRIQRVSFDSISSIGVAYVETNFPQVMRLTKSYEFIPQVFRTSFLVHEARHSEAANNFWAHTECPTPFLNKKGEDVISGTDGLPMAGRRYCDDSEKGAYAVGTIYLSNIVKYCTNCNEKVKADAQIALDDVSMRITNSASAKRLKNDLDY